MVSWYERFRACSGAFMGILAVVTIAKVLGELSDIDEWLMAFIGASGLLILLCLKVLCLSSE